MFSCNKFSQELPIQLLWYVTYGLQRFYFSTSGNSTIKVWLQVAKDLKTISYVNNVSLWKNIYATESSAMTSNLQVKVNRFHMVNIYSTHTEIEHTHTLLKQ